MLFTPQQQAHKLRKRIREGIRMPKQVVPHLAPETASDKNKSVLAAVLRRPLPKTTLLDNCSHESSMLFTPQQQAHKLEQQQVQQLEQQLEQQLVQQQVQQGPPPSRNSLAKALSLLVAHLLDRNSLVVTLPTSFPKQPRTKMRAFSLQFCEGPYQKQHCWNIFHINPRCFSLHNSKHTS